LNNLKENIDTLIDILGVSYTNNKQELEETIQNARFLAESDRVEFNVLNNSDWNSENYVANEIIHEIEDFAKNELFLSKFTSEILDYDLRNISNEFKDLSTKRLKFLSCNYKKPRNQIADFYVSGAPNNNEQIIADLENLIKCQELRNKIRASEVTARKYFGSYWNAEHTDPRRLYELSDWLIKFRNLLLDGKITQKSLK